MKFREAFVVHAFPDVVQTDVNAEDGRAFRVLVVDDDPSIRKMIVAALRRDGYDFMEAPNGRDALDLMRAEHPDVVVLDLMMPIVSGWEVLEERASEPELKKIPVIIVSANRDPEVGAAIGQGVCAFLPKPFDIGALSALVRACLVSSSSE
jgi:sigma-B regulation protein RsbU (phosphoserine phosphatase)